jgi:hypothetical protein
VLDHDSNLLAFGAILRQPDLADLHPEIGIGGTVACPPLPHHRTCGSAYGGSAG